MPARNGEKGANIVSVEENPKVVNRRKYPRIAMTNSCRVTLKNSDLTCDGRMLDISANGFAFTTSAREVRDAKGKPISVTISDFPLLEGKAVEGMIIRVSDHDGSYLVGGRMYEDNKAICNYVNERTK